jgi:long-subunit fatty acid transport protein
VKSKSVKPFPQEESSNARIIAGPIRRNRLSHLICGSIFTSLLVSGGASAFSQVPAALGNVFSAQVSARGGTTAAESGDPLDAVQGNPAGLAGANGRVLDIGGAAIGAWGSFQNSVDPNGKLNGAGVLPFGAVSTALGAGHWRAMAAVTPDMLMRANWSYIDPPGTAGASYGFHHNESEIIALRTSGGVARSFGNHWDAGVTFGSIYNKNTLNAPYIFQQQPALAGLKVLLNLHTAGWGWDGSAGIQWHENNKLRLGAAWKSAAVISSRGTASGTASALFTALGIGASPLFSYKAEVDNHLPWTLGAGGSWQVNPRLRWDFEGDRTAWGNAFHQLPVKLSNGSNSTINSVAGSDNIEDFVPLDWKDQVAIRTGLEKPISEKWTVRGGYSYMSNPVPSSTLTPLTAAILRNSIGGGAGWSHSKWRADLAYQAQLPASQSVGKSALLAGEFDNSHVRAMTQALTLTFVTHF